MAAGSARTVAGFGDVDVVGVRWVNENRLLFAAADLSVNRDDWRSNSQGWFAVNRDGTRMTRDVLKWGWPRQMLDDGSNQVIAERSDGKLHDATYTLWRIDTMNGHDVPLSTGMPQDALGWVLDETGRVRAVTARHENRAVLYRQDDKTKNWVSVIDQPLFGERVQPIEFRHGQMYVTAPTPNSPYRALYRYDLEAGRLDDKPLVAVDGWDFNGALVFDDASKRLIGVRHETDDWSTTWLDPDMKALFEFGSYLFCDSSNDAHSFRE